MTGIDRADPDRSGGRLTHLDEHGKAHMVDVTDPPCTSTKARLLTRLIMPAA